MAVLPMLDGVLPRKTLQFKIRMDADCFSRQGWRCYHALDGVLPRKTPQFKIRMDADFEPPRMKKFPLNIWNFIKKCGSLFI